MQTVHQHAHLQSGSLSARMPARDSETDWRASALAASNAGAQQALAQGALLAASDAEARVNALRLSVKNDIKWALSICSPNSARVARPWDDDLQPQLVLPPLRPLKEYAPATAATGDPANFAAPAMASHSPRNPPKVSQLGSTRLPWADESTEEEAAETFEELAAVAAKRRLVMAKRQRAAAEAAFEARTTSPLQAEARRGVMQRQRTLAMSEGKGKIRGADPMAGSLFSRTARLDNLCKRKGIYEASLYEGSARVAANSGMANVRPRG